MSNSGAYRHHANATTSAHTKLSISSLSPLRIDSNGECVGAVSTTTFDSGTPRSLFEGPCVPRNLERQLMVANVSIATYGVSLHQFKTLQRGVRLSFDYFMSRQSQSDRWSQRRICLGPLACTHASFDTGRRRIRTGAPRFRECCGCGVGSARL